MIIRVDENITIEVYFDIVDREVGYEDDIRFTFHETGPKEIRILKADSTSVLLTPEQADQLAVALMQAAEESRSTPK
jgi:hypothetical protein